MKFSAGEAGRKWPCGVRSRDQWAMVTLGALLISSAAPAEAKIPLPQPRPATAPALDGKQAGPGTAPGPETPPAPSVPLPPSACRLALTDAVAIAPSLPAITGPGACGGDDLVRLEAVVLPDRTRVPVKPAATLRCTMASAIADWVRTDMAPLAEGLGSRVSELDNFDSFECRGRNRVAGAKLSEHGKANALDVRGLRLADGRFIGLTDRAVARDLREKVMDSVCARFTTVLGPGSDGYHENHIHLDLAQRRNGYRICHWELYDSMPAVAPLLPAERPADAPPREVAEGEGKAPVPSPEPAKQSPVTPQAAPPVVQRDAAPEPAKRSPPAISAKRSASSKSTLPASVSAPSSRPAAAKPPKRKRKRNRHNELPPFLRSLFTR
ncbi:MAG: extensin family protein [Proteobacteria bacterium]|nr:extensin family protein [Pseudomonadota bacterium]